MSTISKMEEELGKVAHILKEMPKAMRIFTLCLRSLFVEYAGGKLSDKHMCQLMELRNRTRDDAQVYLRTILPGTVLFIANTKECFEIYKTYEFEDWNANLADIIEMVTDHSVMTTTVVEMHEQLITPLKERKTEATKILKQYSLAVNLDQNEEELEELSASQKTWADWLLAIPGIAEIAGPILNTMANNNSVDAIAEQENVAIAESAIMCIREALIPALMEFIKALQTLAATFGNLKHGLLAVKSNAEDSAITQKHLYYDLMKSKSTQIIQMCDDMTRVIPAVKTDIATIPNEGTNENYVDQWVEKQEKLISKNCKAGVKACLLNALKSIKG